MSVWVNAIEAARIAVKMPIAATTTMTSGARPKIGLARAMRYTPALTIVAAWMRADTGVGPSIASGSQTWSGNWALLPTAPAKSSSAMPVIIQGWIAPDWSAAGSSWNAPGPASVVVKLSVPTVVKMAMMPRAKPKSPTRLTRNAFLLASAADRRLYQKP